MSEPMPVCCTMCKHNKVCRFMDLIKKFEEQNQRVVTSTDYSSFPITINCKFRETTTEGATE